MRQPTDAMSAAERQIFADIAANGVHIVHVAAIDDAPLFSFTIGLWATFAQPEVLVIGLPPEIAADLLDNVADEVDGGRKFAAGEKHEGLVQGYPVYFGAIAAAQAQQWLAAMCWAYERADVPCVQLVYPDKQGRWPWQPDVRDGFRAVQPVLERTAAEDAT